MSGKFAAAHRLVGYPDDMLVDRQAGRQAGRWAGWLVDRRSGQNR